MDAVGAQLERRLDVVVDHERAPERSRSPGPRSTTSTVGVLQPQLDDGRAALDGARAVSRSATSACSLTRLRALIELVGSRRKRVVELDVEEPGPFALPGSVLAGDAESDERLGRRLERRTGDGEEAPSARWTCNPSR